MTLLLTIDHVDIQDRTLSDEEVADLEASDDEPTRVSYSTQDYPIDGLVKRLQTGAMLVPQLSFATLMSVCKQRGSSVVSFGLKHRWISSSSPYCWDTLFPESS